MKLWYNIHCYNYVLLWFVNYVLTESIRHVHRARTDKDENDTQQLH